MTVSEETFGKWCRDTGHKQSGTGWGTWHTVHCTDPELQNVKSFHGPISSNQILPQEKRVHCDIFGTSNLQNRIFEVSCDE